MNTAVVIISEDYANSMWTNHERRSAISRAIEEKGRAYVLPVKVESSAPDLAGIAPTIGYLSLQEYSIEAVGQILIQKLGAADIPGTQP